MVSVLQRSCCDPSSLCHSWKGPGNKWWLGWKPSFSRQRAELEVLHNIYVGWPPGAHQTGCTFFPFLPVSFHLITLHRMFKLPWLLSALDCSVSVQLDAGVILSYVFMRLSMTIDMTWCLFFYILSLAFELVATDYYIKVSSPLWCQKQVVLMSVKLCAEVSTKSLCIRCCF